MSLEEPKYNSDMNDQSTELILQDVRCFHGKQRGLVKPLTLLVGENSTGKTTFLSCFHVLHHLFSELWDIDEQLDFNREPFSMGPFRDIVSHKRGSEENIDQFKLGLEISKSNFAPYHLITTFTELGAQPIVSSIMFQFNEDLFLEIKRGETDGIIVVMPEMKVKVELPFSDALYLLALLGRIRFQEKMFDLYRELSPIVDYLYKVLEVLEFTIDKADREDWRILSRWIPQLNRPIPMAPLRSKPKRTYDTGRENQSLEGGHIPMLMMRLARTDKPGWTTLHDSLVKFGRESGMFSDIKIKQLGQQMSDPFQLQVEVRTGTPANIMDVGYGVSQSLPILVDVMESENKLSTNNDTYSTFLMQQPEVHLHPRTQAELASFFVDSYNKSGNRFLIETHSDFIIDRFRIAVRTKFLEAKDVSILYFEPTENGVNIHNMSLDKYGNLEGAPDSYREFFMKETDRVLGFTD